jgi:hypothetical protein
LKPFSVGPSAENENIFWHSVFQVPAMSESASSRQVHIGFFLTSTQSLGSHVTMSSEYAHLSQSSPELSGSPSSVIIGPPHWLHVGIISLPVARHPLP